ncbi:hypothetical protein J2Y73_005172 [Peribacillus frigoritolerans]|uniref:HNH endonuclease n=1 Tax=Peribacillus frigoritolerans TaxID=450367 RepID=UPI00209DB3F5|nr:HNH endonuclease [Peribacillus frigoritolerans]MCP1495141.1 hypothetical protein [Peribacillus frigoritolerans]
MKHCIYFKKTEPEVTFLSEEHIFPAGIGGKKKLPQEYVSHNCNNAFSSIELEFMRNSLISMPRQFYGPGKRGKLTPSKATKSNISIMTGLNEPISIGFGYISLGKPFNISQIRVNTNGPIQFSSDPSFGDAQNQLSDFARKLESFNNTYILHENDQFDEKEFILGIHDKKWHVGLSNKELLPRVNEFVQKLIDQKSFENKTPSYGTSQPRVHQSIQMDDSYFRVCAKIIFNYLANKKGQDFVLENRFDPLRNWIVNGGENDFATIMENKRIQFEPISFPEQSHLLMITRTASSLMGYISFYDQNFPTAVTLCDDFDEPFEDDGFICDWKNEKEYTLLEFLHEENEERKLEKSRENS